MLPVERADRAREIDRRLRALAGEVEAADSEDIAPTAADGKSWTVGNYH